MRRLWVVLLGVVVALALAIPAVGVHPSSGFVSIYPADDEQAAVDGQPAGAIFLLRTGTHYNFMVKPKRAQRFFAESGVVLDGQGTTDFAFYYDNSGENPHDVIISGRDSAKKLVIKNYGGAGNYQQGMIQPQPSTEGWQLRYLDLSGAYGRAVTLGPRGSLRDSHIHDNGSLGVGGYLAHFSLIENNEIYRSNRAGRFDPDWEAGGIKLATVNNVLIRNNKVADHNGPGIWCDIDCSDVWIDGNTVWYNTRDAIFYEISRRGVITNNWVENSFRGTTHDWLKPNINVTESVDVIIANNTSWYPPKDHIGIRATNRTRSNGTSYATRNIRVYGNRLVGPGGSGAARCCGDGENLFVQGIIFEKNDYEAMGMASRPLFWWSDYRPNWSQWRGHGHDLSGSFTQ